MYAAWACLGQACFDTHPDSCRCEPVALTLEGRGVQPTWVWCISVSTTIRSTLTADLLQQIRGCSTSNLCSFYPRSSSHWNWETIRTCLPFVRKLLHASWYPNDTSCRGSSLTFGFVKRRSRTFSHCRSPTSNAKLVGQIIGNCSTHSRRQRYLIVLGLSFCHMT